MKINTIVAKINEQLAGEMLSYPELQMHMDSVIDDINSELGSCYPAFSELDTSIDEYDMFPDQYLRTVVVPGAAHYFYVMDEEGLESAPMIAQMYSRNLFYMKRDWFNNVPEEYIRTTETGILFEQEIEGGERGVTIDARTFNP